METNCRFLSRYGLWSILTSHSDDYETTTTFALISTLITNLSQISFIQILTIILATFLLYSMFFSQVVSPRSSSPTYMEITCSVCLAFFALWAWTLTQTSSRTWAVWTSMGPGASGSFSGWHLASQDRSFSSDMQAGSVTSTESSNILDRMLCRQWWIFWHRNC